MNTLQQPFGGFQILDGDAMRPPTDYAELETFLSSKDWIIEKTHVGDAEVSTVFLKLEHGGGMWFETMIFGGSHDEFCERYATRAEAEAGHAAIVTALTEGRDPETAVLR